MIVMISGKVVNTLVGRFIKMITICYISQEFFKQIYWNYHIFYQKEKNKRLTLSPQNHTWRVWATVSVVYNLEVLGDFTIGPKLSTFFSSNAQSRYALNIYTYRCFLMLDYFFSLTPWYGMYMKFSFMAVHHNSTLPLKQHRRGRLDVFGIISVWDLALRLFWLPLWHHFWSIESSFGGKLDFSAHFSKSSTWTFLWAQHFGPLRVWTSMR